MPRVYSDGVEGQPGKRPVSTLAAGIAVGAVSLSSAAGDGQAFPPTGDFTLRIEKASDPTHFEHVDCTARSTDTFTITPTTFAWAAGDKISHVIAKVDLDAKQALSAYDAKGDILAASAADTSARLAVGSNFQHLVAASGETTGLKWVGAIGAKVTRDAAQTISNDTITAISFDTEAEDTDGFWVVGTPARITIPSGLGGEYLVTCVASFTGNGTGRREFWLYKNGSSIRRLLMPIDASVPANGTFSTRLSLVATDYLEVFVRQTSGGNLDTASVATWGQGAQPEITVSFLGP